MYTNIVGKGGITAQVIAASISPDNIPIYTLQLKYPRFIHSEFMTHRVFSRNASSSRAIPAWKLLKQIQEQPAMPIHWGKNQPGMQAEEECNNPIPHGVMSLAREDVWIRAADTARWYAEDFMDAGYHKQIVNRLTEPFQFINVVVTSTEWDNFFNLRLHPAAQPEIQELARTMRLAIEASSPVQMSFGDWHLPYISRYSAKIELPIADLIKASVARCARVSYLNHDNTHPDIKKDIELHDKLLKAGHMSPFEHVATPMESHQGRDPYEWDNGVTHMDNQQRHWSGNFRGWIQYRQTT